ncbi:hypothetical protein DO71_5536 [Burkholderia pseudomallei]|nr:hypothetical protein DO71_5536 [Burkholderia pseudomallei]
MCASASQIVCWRFAACALVCAHSVPSFAAIEPSESVHVARRCSSRDSSVACRAECDSLIARSSAAVCCSNAVA